MHFSAIRLDHYAHRPLLRRTVRQRHGRRRLRDRPSTQDVQGESSTLPRHLRVPGPRHRRRANRQRWQNRLPTVDQQEEHLAIRPANSTGMKRVPTLNT